MIQTLLAAGFIVIHIAGFFAAMHAVVYTRTPQGAIGWGLGLLLLPYLTLLPYLYLGQSRFRGYLGDRPHPLAATLFETPASPPGSQRFTSLCALQGRPFVAGHDLQLLIDGDAAFDAMLTAMAAAEHYLLVQFFILRDDALGQRLQQMMLQRAAAGVRVHVLFDGVGSRDLPRHYVETLLAGGVAIRAFATHRWRNRLQLNFRNHRKILVVDGERAFVGGLNVGDEYLGLRPPLAPWRDTHLAIRGPVVGDLQRLFANDWQWITGQLPTLLPPAAADGDASVLIVASGPADPQETGSLFFTAAINAARERIWLSSPYFVPDHSVRTALHLAVLRGVDVRVLIPSRADHHTVFLSSSLHAHHAIRAGVKVFRYQPGFLHQKAILIDHDTAAIGSMNLDTRSFRLNFEVSALVLDPSFAADVAQMLQADFKQAVPVERSAYQNASYPRRVAMHLARLLDPIL